MKPVSNTKTSVRIQFGHGGREERFINCLRCHHILEENVFMHEHCWTQSNEDDRDLCYRLTSYLVQRNLEFVDVEEDTDWREPIHKLLGDR